MLQFLKKPGELAAGQRRYEEHSHVPDFSFYFAKSPQVVGLIPSVILATPPPHQRTIGLEYTVQKRHVSPQLMIRQVSEDDPRFIACQFSGCIQVKFKSVLELRHNRHKEHTLLTVLAITQFPSVNQR